MNRRTSERDLERLLDADRGDFGAIYDRLSRVEPPRRLDRAILAEASRAALGPRAPRTQRWLLGLGSAAGLVLAAGIAWQVGREIESKHDDASGAARQESAPRSVVPVQPIAAPTAPDEVPAPPPAVAPPALSKTIEREAKAKPLDGERARRAVQAEPARPMPFPAPAAAPPAPVAAAPASSAAAPVAEAETAKAESNRVEAQAERATSAESRDTDRGAFGRAGNADAAAAPPRRQAAARERMPATPSTSVQLRTNMQLAPAAWIAEIRRLADAGQHQQAVENLRLFRRMHPDWPVDDDLSRLDE